MSFYDLHSTDRHSSDQVSCPPHVCPALFKHTFRKLVGLFSIPPAILTPPAAPLGYRCRWNHPGKSSSCSECCPGEGWLTTARRSLMWRRRGVIVDTYKRFTNAAACCAGVIRATHCLRVAGRNPTISMASWSLSKSCFRSSPSTVKQSCKTATIGLQQLGSEARNS